jgi:predicted molibdopterin-dependent oxidoreductase YjgC
MNFESVLATCPYCGVGCNLIFQVLDGQIIGALPGCAVHLRKAA